MSNSDRFINHKRDALQILSGGLSEGMNTHNVEEKVSAAICASSLLVRKLNKLYESEDLEIKNERN